MVCLSIEEVMTMAGTGTDSYLRFLRGEEAALEELICTYSDALIRFAFCYVGSSAIAEDVMEDALTDVLMKGKRFDDEAHFKAYLYKAVRHRSSIICADIGRMFRWKMWRIFCAYKALKNILC